MRVLKWRQHWEQKLDRQHWVYLTTPPTAQISVTVSQTTIEHLQTLWDTISFSLSPEVIAYTPWTRDIYRWACGWCQCVCLPRHVPAARQDAQAGVRVGVPVRQRRRLQHLGRVGVARAGPRLPAVARLAGDVHTTCADQRPNSGAVIKDLLTLVIHLYKQLQIGQCPLNFQKWLRGSFKVRKSFNIL